MAWLRHSVPGLADARDIEYMDMRDSVFTPEAALVSLLHDPVYSTSIDAIVPEGDADVLKALTAPKPRPRAQPPAASSAPPAHTGASTASSLSSGSGVRRTFATIAPATTNIKIPNLEASVNMDAWATPFVPTRNGCHTRIETHMYGRGRGEYSGRPPGKQTHFTNTYGDAPVITTDSVFFRFQHDSGNASGQSTTLNAHLISNTPYLSCARSHP